MVAAVFLNQSWLIFALLGALIFVNGWTDAPNAVATAVASKALSFRRACVLAAGFNFLGLISMLWLPAAVSREVIASVPEGEGKLALLCAAMIAVVVFSAVAAIFGIPTSESHALLAAISGGSVALFGARGFSFSLWGAVLIGIIFTSAGGFLQGLIYKRALEKTALSGQKRRLKRLEIVCAALLSFIHGAQDGQKFAAVMIMTLALIEKPLSREGAYITCAAILGLSTALGGKKIIKKVGNGITVVDEGGGFCADAAAVVSLFICTAFGLPVSTTHTKTSAILGVGKAQGRVNLKTYYEIFSLWLLTFPVCFSLGYFLTLICF